MTSSTPLYITIGIALLTAILGFLFNFLLNRMTKRQDRRLEWYEAVDKQLRQLEMIQYQLDQTKKIVADVAQLLERMTIVEVKIGLWYRHIEDKQAERLEPPPRYSGQGR